MRAGYRTGFGFQQWNVFVVVCLVVAGDDRGPMSPQEENDG